MSETSHNLDMDKVKDHQRRKLDRAKVAFSGKILTTKGITIGDCTICDLSIVGARVILSSPQPIPEQIYLMDVTNDIAYDARVAWWRPRLAGLAFQKIFELGEGLPDHLEFLNRAIFDFKLGRVEQLTAEGKTLGEAVRLVGITSEMYARGSSEKAQDSDLAGAVWRLETENATLRKLLNEKLGGENASGVPNHPER